VSETLLYLSRADVEKVDLPMSDIIDAVEAMFREKGEGRTEMPPKPGIHPSRDGFIHAMPAYVPAVAAAGLKWVSAYPENKDRGLPYVSGLITMNDPSNGLPTAVLDCTWVTAMRTAAATAVAAKHLARPESRVMGILGCGVQGRSNAEALACQFDLDLILAYDHRASNSDRYVEEVSAKLDVTVERVDSAREAVHGADLVVTAGPILKQPTPTIEAGWLQEGAFACPLDFDSYWTGEALAAIDKLATDDQAQLGYYREMGYFSETPAVYADLGEIVAGSKPGRGSPNERTMSINLGLALEDVVTALPIIERARAMGIGTELSL